LQYDNLLSMWNKDGNQLPVFQNKICGHTKDEISRQFMILHNEDLSRHTT
jgi:hypothetical protein